MPALHLILIFVGVKSPSCSGETSGEPHFGITDIPVKTFAHATLGL